MYRGTSRIRSRPALGPYSKPMPRALAWSYVEWRFLMNEVPLYKTFSTCIAKQLFSWAGTHHCRANMAHVRQSRPDHGLGLSLKSPGNVFSCSLFARKRSRRGITSGTPSFRVKSTARAGTALGSAESERHFVIDNLLVRIHFIIDMIWWTGLAPWEF